MHDPAPDREPRGNERWILAAAFLLALGALGAIVVDDYEPAKLAPVFMLLSWFPLIALHELGHAVAARLVGWRVEQIVVGFGREALSFEVWGVPFVLKTYPLGGYVVPAPRRLEGIRLRSALVYAAGPLAELALVGGIALALGPEVLFARTDAVGVIALQAVAIAATLGAGLNLVPRRVETERGTSLSDGMGVLASLVRPAASFAAELRAAHEARVRGARDEASALAACEEAYAALGDDPHLRAVMIATLERVDADVEGRALPERVLSRLARGPSSLTGSRRGTRADARAAQGSG
ncbi:MAG: site-2 protease family protein [Sandaracinaceae bacterium]|nr:site-2 protease family protein [Sandaracinaceae bacterium]